MMGAAPVASLTLRGLLDRRRSWLMAALAAVPVLMAALVVISEQARLTPTVFDTLLIRTVLPLIALVFGTASIGSELEEGTIVYLLVKPITRLRIVLAKGVVAAGLTAALVVPSTLLTGIVASTATPRLLGISAGYAVAIGIGAAAYGLAFMALSTFTSRALAIGLGYVLLWEGILSGLLEGTRTFSIRQATLSLAVELSGARTRQPLLEPLTAVVVLTAVIAGALALATWRMSRFELRGGE